MTDLQLAIAFITVCARLGIGNGERGKLLLKAGGIGRIMEYLESCGDPPAVLIRGLKEEADRQRRRSYPAPWEAVTLADASYPERLRHISLPPAILFVSGMNMAAINSPAVIAVIGSRRPSVYGIEVTRKLTAAIAARGVPVVSGGARGIDALAHRTALQKGG
ncbi:MAG: DNA-processing protein DprA, partial [Candidatus Cloacimonadaceae bacterium]